MLSPYLTVTAVVVGVALLHGAGGLLLVLLPLRMSAENFPLQTIGWVAAAHGAGFLLGCTLVGRMIAAIGHIRVFAALAATLATVVLAFAAWQSAPIWIFLRLIGGACFAGLFTVAESWIADRTPTQQRGRVLSFYTVCSKAALVAAPMALTVLDTSGPLAFMLISALCSLALLPVASTRSASPAPPALSALGVRVLYRLAPVALLGCFVTGLINAPVLGLIPLYGESIGLDLTQVVLLLPLLQLGSMVMQWPLGRWSDHGDRRRVIAGLFAAIALISLVLWLLPRPPDAVLAGMLFVLGGASLSVYAICIAHAGDHATPEQMVPLVSSLLLVWGVGAVIGPALAAALMAWLGASSLFLYSALVAASFALYAVWRMRRRAAVPDEEHVHFVNMPATSLAAVELGVADALHDKLDMPTDESQGASPASRSGDD